MKYQVFSGQFRATTLFALGFTYARGTPNRVWFDLDNSLIR